VPAPNNLPRLLGLLFLTACATVACGEASNGNDASAEEDLALLDFLNPFVRHVSERELAKPELALRAGEEFATVDAVQRPGDDLGPLSDEFDDPGSLAKWTKFSDAESRPDQIKQIDVGQTSPGHLYIEPWSSYWFNDFHAPFLYKDIEGDFVVTSRIKVEGNGRAVPTQSFSLAGLLVRMPHEGGAAAWSPGREHWAFITAGSGDGRISQIEAKNTVSSKSKLELSPARADWLELRIVRRGSQPILLRRFEGDGWTVVRRIDKPELPNRVQVGMIAYTDFPHTKSFLLLGRIRDYQRTVVTTGEPDLKARFDWVRFQRPTSP
jgi:hypothetical protein